MIKKRSRLGERKRDVRKEKIPYLVNISSGNMELVTRVVQINSTKHLASMSLTCQSNE